MTALEKAKLALEHAAEMDVDLEADVLPKKYHRLLDLAQIQANIAQADSLQDLARKTIQQYPGTSIRESNALAADDGTGRRSGW